MLQWLRPTSGSVAWLRLDFTLLLKNQEPQFVILNSQFSTRSVLHGNLSLIWFHLILSYLIDAYIWSLLSRHVMSCSVISLLNSRYVDTEMLAADSIYCRRLIVAISSSCTLPLLLLLPPFLLFPFPSLLPPPSPPLPFPLPSFFLDLNLRLFKII